MASIKFAVDGRAVALNADPSMPLLYALRNDLKMTNPHFGCGLAQCGACTVQAPHCASPQPKCGLLILRSLRSAYRSGMLGSALTATDLPSTANLMLAMEPPLDVRPGGYWPVDVVKLV